MTLESYILDTIEDRARRPAFKKFLQGMSYLFRFGVFLRNQAYDQKWLKVASAPIPVISVGNIVAGGAGKTPIVHLLAQALQEKKKVAILTRGYRSQIEKSGDEVNISQEPPYPVELCGDEPFWLASQLPKVSVWVGKNRKRSSLKAANEGTEILLLDDGLQYRSLKRDVEIVVMDGRDPFGKHHFLPCGFLRDHPKRLKSATLIVVNNVESEEHFETIKKQLALYSSAPVVGMQLLVENRLLKDKKVGLFCAIARPDRFVQTVKSQEAEVVNALFAPDHQSFSEEELLLFASMCHQKGADCLVCTEKDAVKLPSTLACCMPIVVIKTQLEIVFGEKHWQELVETLKG